MYGQVHANIVFYRNAPGVGNDVQAGNQFKQIAVVEREQYEVRIFEGEVRQPEPNFSVDNPDAMVALHDTLAAALRDAEAERAQSIQDGWEPYHIER